MSYAGRSGADATSTEPVKPTGDGTPTPTQRHDQQERHQHHDLQLPWQFFTPDEVEIEWARSRTRGRPEALLRLLVLLKSCGRLGYFPDLEQVPELVVVRIRAVAGLPGDVGAVATGRSAERYRAWVREHLGLVHDPVRARKVALAAMEEADPKLRDPLARYVVTAFTFGSGLGADVVDAHLDLDLVRAWGDGSVAAVDGTMMDAAVDNLLAETSIRYGAYGGISHHLVADTYVALFSRFVPCGVWEAVYLIDSLLQNQSQARPDQVHADTQGQSFPVFGLAHVLGIDLLPRIRNFQDLTFHRPAPPRPCATGTST